MNKVKFLSNVSMFAVCAGILLFVYLFVVFLKGMHVSDTFFTSLFFALTRSIIGIGLVIVLLGIYFLLASIYHYYKSRTDFYDDEEVSFAEQIEKVEQNQKRFWRWGYILLSISLVILLFFAIYLSAEINSLQKNLFSMYSYASRINDMASKYSIFAYCHIIPFVAGAIFSVFSINSLIKKKLYEKKVEETENA